MVRVVALPKSAEDTLGDYLRHRGVWSTRQNSPTVRQSGPHLYQFHIMIFSWVTTHTMEIC